MKLLFASAFAFVSLSVTAHAATVESSPIGAQIGAPASRPAPLYRRNLTEAGFQMSSINDGTAFATVGFMHEFDNGFTAGIRGFLPMQYTKQTQAYIGQLVGRFMLINDMNQMYLETNVSQGAFNDAAGTAPFAMIGGTYGYMRRINNDMKVGASVGLDYATTRISQDSSNYGSRTLYNSVAINGSFYF